MPLRQLAQRVRLLTDEEAKAAMPANMAERVFVVRYAGGDNGGPIEPVQILPEGLSLAEYEISFAAGAAALRVEHRQDGPVKCRAEPAAHTKSEGRLQPFATFPPAHPKGASRTTRFRRPTP